MAAALAVAGLCAGCAVQTGPRTLDFTLDKAALLGTELSTFKLQDGSAASLRVYTSQRGQEFSIKLEKYLKVIELGNAERMRVLRVELIEDRTVIVLSRGERTCLKAMVLSIKDREVLNWTVTYAECHTEPELQVEGDRMYLVYPGVRFAYRGESLTKELLPIARPTLAAPPGTVNPAASVPPKPVPNTAAVAPAPTPAAARPQPRPAARPPAPAVAPTAVAAKPADSTPQSQKPVRIILD